MHISKTVSTGIILIIALLTMPVVQAAKTTGLNECTEIIEPGSYELKGNLPGNSGLLSDGSCVLISSDFVTLDLQGFTIYGDGTGDCITTGPIGSERVRSIAIRNGTVTGCRTGINSSRSVGIHIERIQAAHNTEDGIFAGLSARVNDCVVSHNGGDGIETSLGCTVTGNIAHGNDGSGIAAWLQNTVTYNTARNNGGNGISCAGKCTMVGNTTAQSDDFGIVAGAGSTVTSNTAAGGPPGQGIKVTCPSNVRGNTAVFNSLNLNLVLVGEGCNLDNNVAP